MSSRPFAWEKSYVPGLRWDAPIHITTIPAMFDKAVADYGPKPFIEFRGRTLSFDALADMVEGAAAAIYALGHDRENPIALYLPNTPYHPISFFAGLKAGTVLVHLSPLDAERELAHKIRDCGARTVVTTNFPAMLSNALKLLDQELVDLVIVGEDAEWGPSQIPLMPIPDRPGVVRFKTLVKEAPPRPRHWPETLPEHIAMLQYTGGTTGLPKGAMLSHGNLSATISIYETYNAMPPELSSEPRTPIGEEIIIGVLPLFHIYALTTVLLRGLVRGALILLRVRFDPDQTLHDIEVNRATWFPGVPTMWIALANRPDIAERDLSSLTVCSSGGAPLPVDVKHAIREAHRAHARRRLGHDRDLARRHVHPGWLWLAAPGDHRPADAGP